MEENNLVKNAFGNRKVFLAITLGLFIAGFMVYSAINTTHFIEVSDRTGTHTWIDINHNGRIDFELKNEFIPHKNGLYREQKVSDAIASVHWTGYSYIWLSLAILFMFFRDFFYMLRIRLLTKGLLTWRSSFSVIMLWEFASAISPGVMSGAAVAMFIMNKEKIELGKSTAIVLATAMLDNLFYILFIPIAFLFFGSSMLFPDELENASAEWVFWSGFLVISCVFLFLFTSIFIYPTFAEKALNAGFSLPILKKWKSSVSNTGKNITIAAREMKKEKLSNWIKVFGATCGSWLSRFLVINALLQAFLRLRFHDHLVIMAKQFILWLFMRISPTPGGSGVAEYAFGELLSPFTQSVLLLVGLAILWRLISYFPYLFIGAIILPGWLKNKNLS